MRDFVSGQSYEQTYPQKLGEDDFVHCTVTVQPKLHKYVHLPFRFTQLNERPGAQIRP